MKTMKLILALALMSVLLVSCGTEEVVVEDNAGEVEVVDNEATEEADEEMSEDVDAEGEE